MGRGRHLLERLTDETDLVAEPFPGKPIVEIAGEHRVLIENHCGVKAYMQEQIIVEVRFGFIVICGCNMEIMRMTKDQLVIHGRIDTITLQRREKI